MNTYKFRVSSEVEVQSFTLEDALEILDDYFGPGPLTDETTILQTEVEEHGPVS